MNVLITGATGMVGSNVLKLCLADKQITQVTVLGRRSCGISHHKLKEILVTDFTDLSGIRDQLALTDTVYYCLGAYTGQLPREEFYQVNVTYPKQLSEQIQRAGKADVRFCLLSGAGADRLGESSMTFAKDKGEIENYLSLHHPNFHTFRPGYIYPVEPRKEPNFMYRVSRWLYPLIKLMGANASITSVELAAGMFKVGVFGHHKQIFENADIRQMV